MRVANLNEQDGASGWQVPMGSSRKAPRWSQRRAVPHSLRLIAGTLREWVRRVWQRRQLRAVLERDARFFLDIGVSRATVYNEASKWFWQA